MGSTEINIHFEYTPDFLKAAKVLAKRYHSFKKDLNDFLTDLKENPAVGVDLGNGIRKIRMKIASKGKGKSGGARVITFTLVIDETNSKITLLYIYDKSDQESISKEKVTNILKSNGLIN